MVTEPRYGFQDICIRAIIIKRLISIIFLLIIVALAFVIAGFYISYMISFNADITPAEQKSLARDIALRDGYVGQYLSTGYNYSFGEITKPPPGYYAYSSNASRLIVPIRLNGSPEGVLRVTVDLRENRTVSILHDSGSNLAWKVQADAMNAVINDPSIVDMIKNSAIHSPADSNASYPAVYIIDTPTVHGQDAEYGFVNATATYVDVHVQAGETYPFYRTADAIVDAANGTVLAERFKDGEGLHPEVFNVTIPAGKGFYRSYGGYFNRTVANYPPVNVSFNSGAIVIGGNGNAQVSPIFVDEADFNRLRNGSAYTTLNDRMSVSDKGWIITIPARTSFYMVLDNKDVRDAVVTIQSSSLTF